MSRVSLVGVFCAACAGASPVGASDGDASSARVLRPGCVGSGFGSVQAAIDASRPGDVIEVCPGTWQERLVVRGQTLTLRSRDGAAATVIDAGGLGVALTVQRGADVTVEGLTLRGGVSAGVGGNLACVGSRIVVRDSVVDGGRAGSGGGFGTRTCTGAVEDSTFRGNRAVQEGGGLYARAGLDLLRNTFDGNTAEFQGGGAFVRESTSEIRGNRFTANTAVDDGGGCVVVDGAPRVIGNTFDGNTTGDEGGGLRVKGSEAVITDNLIRNNHADYRGGGAKISHDEVTMSGNTFEGNTAWGPGGALLLYESASVLTGEAYLHNRGTKGGGVAVVEGWGDVVFVDARFEDNTADELGGHLYVDLGGFETVLRRGHLVRGAARRGGAIAAESETADEPPTGIRLENTLVRANVADAAGGGLHLDTITGALTNSVLAENEAPEGAAIQVVEGVPGLAVTNTVLVANRGSAAVRLGAGTAPTFRHDDFHDNDADVEGLPACVGRAGNLGVAPGFVDPAASDYHLVPASPLVDAGDPTLADGDGTRSDIGLHGGPLAEP